ncbi:MAG: hypothetical protein K1X88_19550, partial [Nannocystaceae bacterium]|nr:hypothetical protein [Nannocystaceae bacterium]
MSMAFVPRGGGRKPATPPACVDKTRRFRQPRGLARGAAPVARAHARPPARSRAAKALRRRRRWRAAPRPDAVGDEQAMHHATSGSGPRPTLRRGAAIALAAVA